MFQWQRFYGLNVFVALEVIAHNFPELVFIWNVLQKGTYPKALDLLRGSFHSEKSLLTLHVHASDAFHVMKKCSKYEHTSTCLRFSDSRILLFSLFFFM